MKLSSLIAAALLPVGLATVPVQAQDLDHGKQLYQQCAACHSIDGSNGAGPSLQGVFDRKAGSLAGFRFSRAMKNANISWSEATLEAYLLNPQQLIPGNVMPFSGMPDAKDRAGLIGYLKTLK